MAGACHKGEASSPHLLSRSFSGKLDRIALVLSRTQGQRWQSCRGDSRAFLVTCAGGR
jgi:hypothetical protein